MDVVQKSVTEWARLRAETVRLQTEWQWQRGTLEASLTALQARISRLEQDRDVIEATIAREAATMEDAIKRNEDAREALATVERHVDDLTKRLLTLRPFLPPRLSQGLELPFRSLQDPELGPAERMQHVVTIFNRCNLFNKSITFAEEALTLDDDANPRLLEVLYWGLAHAYALDRSSHVAYFGHPGDKGWTWEPRPEATAAVARLLAIHHEESDPRFIPVPVQVFQPPVD